MKLTSIVLAGAAIVGFMSSAFAADLIVEQPPEVGVVDVGGNWDGVYIGGFVGAGWGVADHTNAVPPSPCAVTDGCDLDLSGWLAGVTAGVNFTVGGNFVLGVAGDIAWADISGSDTVPFDYENSVNWEGSVRAVAGYDAGAFLPYITAGVAFANATHSSVIGEADVTHIGATVGVGVQIAVADNMALDLQYRHSWYGEEEYDVGFAPFNPVYALQTDRITAGLNFRF